MVNLLWLALSLAFIQISFSYTIPYGFSGGNADQFVKNIIEQSKTNEVKINDECVLQLKLFVKNLLSTEDGQWAVKMVDASAKPPAGFYEENVDWLGNFDECLEIEATQVDVKAKYCLANLNGTVESKNLNLLQNIRDNFQKLHGIETVERQDSLSISFAVCIPHKCNIDDVRNVLHFVDPSKTFAITCQTKEDLHKPLDTGAIITIAYFGFFIVLMTIATMYDLYRNKADKPHPVLMAFSTYTNTKRLFKISKNSGEFSCLHGLRFFSMLWVIVGHVASCILVGPIYNITSLLEYIRTTKSLVFVNAVYSVDTFFVITGFLVVYSFMKSMHQGHKFNIIIFYLHRYLRLTPPLIPIILASIFLIKYLGSGPFYPQTVQYSEVCVKHWWSTILYIQNYVNVDQECVSQTWYLNADWQLYLIAPIFLLFLPKRPIIGLLIVFCGIVGSMASSFVVTWQYEISGLESNLYRKSGDFLNKYYLKTHNRAATWLIGAILGYIFAKINFEHKLKTLKLPKWLVGLGWIIVLIAMPVILFAGLDDLNNVEYHAYSNALYNTFARPGWGVCIAWIIFACGLGYGGLINSILSLPLFQVLNRFTYSMYLLHLTLLYLMSFAAKQPVAFSVFNVAYSFWGIFALCFGLSIFWVLAFESPIPALEKYLLGKLMGSGKTKKEVKEVKSTETVASSIQPSVPESIQTAP